MFTGVVDLQDAIAGLFSRMQSRCHTYAPNVQTLTHVRYRLIAGHVPL
jgi:hypothetical protein